MKKHKQKKLNLNKVTLSNLGIEINSVVGGAEAAPGYVTRTHKSRTSRGCDPNLWPQPMPSPNRNTDNAEM